MSDNLDVDTATRAARQGGEPLPDGALEFFEPRLGHDLAGVRVHTGAAADTGARAVQARAYTLGADIVFGAGEYAPGTHAGQSLLAHELAHVVQQSQGKVAAGVSQPGDAGEREADRIASELTASSTAAGGVGPAPPQPLNSPLRMARTPEQSPARPALQRQYSSNAATQSNPDSLIPVADVIRYVETVETSFPADTPEETVTRIRQEYYSGMAFEALIPDAHYRRLAPAYAQSPGGGGSAIYYTNNLSDMRWNSASRPAYEHLTAHADENAIGDNPSPYIVLADGSRVDAGHLLLGLDTLLHPRVGAPYTSYGITGIDPAGFAADLALASYWTSYHQRTGSPASDAAVKPPTADFDAYYRASAPNEDLLGDADAFSANQQWTATPGQRLSQVLRAVYLGASGAAPGVDKRWRTFCSANGLGYTSAGGVVSWSPGIEAAWEPRINRLCDLFDSGFFSKVGSMTVGNAPSPGNWPHSLPALRRFLAWLKPKLEAEIVAHP